MTNAAETDSELQQVSDLIGMIYDCAIDPTRWPGTLDAIREYLNCANGTLYIFDVQSMSYLINENVGIEAEWQAKMPGYYGDIAEIFAYLGDVFSRPLEKIFVLREEIPDTVLENNRYFLEWARPQGIEDLLQATLIRTPTRMAMLALGRHHSSGRVTDFDVEKLTLLAPHLRRAVRIADLISAKSLEATTVGSALDAVAVPIFIVAGNGEILRSNHAAQALLVEEPAIGVSDGRLCAKSPLANRRLTDALTRATQDTIDPDDLGSGIVLSGDPGDIVIAYVLPLSRGALRTCLMPRAVAAVFVASGSLDTTPDLHPLTEIFGLTPAEVRLLFHLCQGENLDDAASVMGIAKTTAKTHLAHLFSKTDTRRQGALVALANSLIPPINRTTG